MFTTEQLDLIKSCAKKCKNQGEMSVYINLGENIYYEKANFTALQWNVIKYCAEECKRQRSGEMSVYDMVNAWDYASKDEDWLLEENTLHLTLPFIERIGQIVEPIDNKKGFRTIPIGVGNGFEWIEKAPWHEVPERLENLLIQYYGGYLTPSENPEENYYLHKLTKRAEDQFYYEYEDIHPFRDGNGRSGKILYNYLCGTLDAPILPPNFWNSSNP